MEVLPVCSCAQTLPNSAWDRQINRTAHNPMSTKATDDPSVSDYALSFPLPVLFWQEVHTLLLSSTLHLTLSLSASYPTSAVFLLFLLSLLIFSLSPSNLFWSVSIMGCCSSSHCDEILDKQLMKLWCEPFLSLSLSLALILFVLPFCLPLSLFLFGVLSALDLRPPHIGNIYIFLKSPSKQKRFELVGNMSPPCGHVEPEPMSHQCQYSHWLLLTNKKWIKLSQNKSLDYAHNAQIRETNRITQNTQTLTRNCVFC